MDRLPSALKVADLRAIFYDIEFPEYQREPDVWSREQKQRLIDSIMRRFDISSIYFYQRDDGSLECIDGRQRLNAIMSFLGMNEADTDDNGFALRFHNEIASTPPTRFEQIDGWRFDDIAREASADGPSASVAREARASLLEYPVTAVYLSGSRAPEEFNLQFLRLNLGTLINAGEKLNAMIGGMRDAIFEPYGIGGHPFLEFIGIPTRRFAREQVAAQIALQVFSRHEKGEFVRARHFDLQRFFKTHVGVDRQHPLLEEVRLTFDALRTGVADARKLLRNRAIVVSVVVLAWERRLWTDDDLLASYHQFLREFIGRLRWQVDNMKKFQVDERYQYLVEYQRHLTQASVERPALERRHDVMSGEFARWLETAELAGDSVYREEVGKDPPRS